MPPVSQTKIDVGTVSSPGCSKTRRGLLRDPDHLPDRRAEGARALEPLAVRLVVLPVRHHAPVVELLAVDGALGAELDAEVVLLLAEMTATGIAAARRRDLDRLAAEPAGAAPDQHDVVLLDLVRRPAHQHAVGGRADQHVGRRGLPRQVLRLRQALVRLHARELREAAPVGLVAPDAEARAVHRVAARLHDRVVRVPRSRSASPRGRRP